MADILVTAGIILFIVVMGLGVISWLWNLSGGLTRLLSPRDPVADLRQALDGVEIRIAQDGDDRPGVDAGLHASQSPLEQWLRPSGAAGRALHAAEMTQMQALQEKLANQLEQARALQANMSPPAPLARLSQRERDIAVRTQAPIDVTAIPKSPLARLRRHETRIARRQD